MSRKLACAWITFPISLLAYHNGAPLRNTGNIDGGQDCTSCHRTFAPANSDPRGSVTIENLKPYVPGVVQNLRVVIRHPQASSWGFQLTSRFVTGGGTLKAGSFTPGSETKVVCDDGSQLGAPGPCSAEQMEWIEHTDAPRTATGAGHGFDFQWTPPPQENGDITLYVAATAADGDGTAANDWIYTAAVRIPLSPDAACSMTQRPQIRTAVNAGSHAGPFSSNSMVEIYGMNFQSGSRTRLVGAGDLGSGVYPSVLSCVAVEIGGVRVPVTYIQQDQINVQAPTVTTTGPVTMVVVANPGKPNELRSDTATLTYQQPAPSFFTFGGTNSIAAQFAGKADIVASPAVVAGGHEAKPGDIITIYGTGFGSTSPALQAGQIASGLARLTDSVTVSIAGIQLAPDDILYAGLSPQSISGLYQFNVRIPAAVPDGDAPVTITIKGVSTQAGATVPVKRPAQ